MMDVNKAVAELRNEVTSLKVDTDNQYKHIKSHDIKLDKISYELNRLHQYSLTRDIIIHGIPNDRQEDVNKVFKKLTNVLLINEEMVLTDIHRLPSRSEQGASPLLIRFLL